MKALLLKKIRKQTPLVLNITNYVVMNWSANCLLSIGASPLMAHAQEEMDEMTSLANSLVVNIGTLDSYWIQSMKLAMSLAKNKNKPVIFDPVGAGANRYRTETALDLIEANTPTVIRGNASEILSLAYQNSSTRGVDSSAESHSAIEAGQELAKRFHTLVCISGSKDFIISESKILESETGHPLMTSVTGMGCALSSIIGAFCSVTDSVLEASYEAINFFGSVGERAQKESLGTGSFSMKFLDHLYLESCNHE